MSRASRYAIHTLMGLTAALWGCTSGDGLGADGGGEMDAAPPAECPSWFGVTPHLCAVSAEEVGAVAAACGVDADTISTCAERLESEAVVCAVGDCWYCVADRFSTRCADSAAHAGQIQSRCGLDALPPVCDRGFCYAGDCIELTAGDDPLCLGEPERVPWPEVELRPGLDGSERACRWWVSEGEVNLPIGYDVHGVAEVRVGAMTLGSDGRWDLFCDDGQPYPAILDGFTPVDLACPLAMSEGVIRRRLGIAHGAFEGGVPLGTSMTDHIALGEARYRVDVVSAVEIVANTPYDDSLGTGRFFALHIVRVDPPIEVLEP